MGRAGSQGGSRGCASLGHFIKVPLSWGRLGKGAGRGSRLCTPPADLLVSSNYLSSWSQEVSPARPWSSCPGWSWGRGTHEIFLSLSPEQFEKNVLGGGNKA